MTQIPEGPRPVPSCVLSTPPASPVRSRLWSQGLEDVLKNYYPTCDNFEQRMNMLFFDWTDHQNPRRHPEYGVQQAHPPMPETLRAPSQRSLPSSPFSPTTCGGPVYSPSFATTPQTGLASHPHELNMRNHTFVVNANLPGQKRKRRPYNKQKREEVSQTRKRGACSKCSQRHKKCTHSHSKDASFGSNPGEASTLDNGFIKIEDINSSSYTSLHADKRRLPNAVVPLLSAHTWNGEQGSEDSKTHNTLRYITTVIQSFELHQYWGTTSVKLSQNYDETYT